MKGEPNKKKRKCQVVESSLEGNSTSSAKSSGSIWAPISDGSAASVIAVSADDSNVVKLSSQRNEALVVHILKKALVLLGFNVAYYDTKFFEDVAGLCSIGRDVSDVPGSADKKLDWKLLFLPKAGYSQVSQVWLKNGVDNEIAEYLSMLWTSVYGHKIDNGSVSHELYRVAMYSKGSNPSKWTKHAVAVYSKKISNAARNP